MGPPSVRSPTALFLVAVLVAGLVAVDPHASQNGNAQGTLPDLIVADITVFVSDWNVGHTITVSIKNQGAATSTSFATKVVIDGDYETTLMIGGMTQAGETRTVTTNLPTWYPGTHTFNVTTDATAKVSESNEANNKLVRTLAIDSGPELSITSMRILSSLETHLLEVVAFNSGQSAYGPIDLRVNKPNIMDETQSRASMQGNSTWTAYFSLDGWRTGSVLVNATIDAAGSIAEVDETNNRRTEVLATPGAPRLTVRNITPDNDVHIAFDEPILVRWQVHNAGTVDAHTVPLDIRFAGERTIVEPTTGLIPADSAVHMAEGYIMAPSVGNVTLRITIDPEGTQGEIASPSNVFDRTLRIFEPRPLAIGDTYVGNETRWVDGTRVEHVTVQATGTGDHFGSNARIHLYDEDRLVASAQELAEPDWYGGLFQPPAANMSYRHGRPGEYVTTFWHTFSVPTEDSHEPAFRAVVEIDNGTAWASTGEGYVGQPYIVDTNHQPSRPSPPSPPPREDVQWRSTVIEGTPIEAPDQPEPIRAADGVPEELPVELEVAHLDTRPDPEHPGAYLLRFLVKGLGPGGTGTDLGVVAKVGWEIEVLTSSQDIAEGATEEYVLRLTPPESGRTSSTITVGAWGEAARAEPVVVNVRGLTTSGNAAGHPVPVWGYASGAAVVAAAAGAFVWFAEPRRYGFLRYLLAMFPVVGGFSRIQGEKVLEHEARERIHQAIESQPGIHYRALLRELRMSNGRLAHHLQTLEREGIIRTEPVGGKLHLYVVGSTAVRGTPLSDRQRALLAMIKKEPGILQSRLAERLGVSRQALHQHLDSLREQNLLLDARYGRTKALYLEVDADQRLTVCVACRSFYDRGAGMTSGVVCPSCGQSA